MSFKIRFDIDPDHEEEIIIKCKSANGEAMRAYSLLTERQNSEIELFLNGEIYFVGLNELLFFETYGTKTAAHTKNRMYYTDLKLYELEEQLPSSFMRISKSAIINTKAVTSMRREITGICEAFFSDTPKKVYISRSYYRSFKNKIYETRLKK